MNGKLLENLATREFLLSEYLEGCALVAACPDLCWETITYGVFSSLPSVRRCLCDLHGLVLFSQSLLPSSASPVPALCATHLWQRQSPLWALQKNVVTGLLAPCLVQVENWVLKKTPQQENYIENCNATLGEKVVAVAGQQTLMSSRAATAVVSFASRSLVVSWSFPRWAWNPVSVHLNKSVVNLDPRKRQQKLLWVLLVLCLQILPRLGLCF